MDTKLDIDKKRLDVKDKNKVNIFYSYSHRDEDLRERFEIHMAGLIRKGTIENWHDKKILSGENFENVIDSYIIAADIIIFFVSADFIASDYCHDKEVVKAVARHYDELCTVVPIILRECDWEGTPFEGIHGLPTNMKPVVSRHWNDTDEAFASIVKELKKIINKKSSDKINNNKIKYKENDQRKESEDLVDSRSNTSKFLSRKKKNRSLSNINIASMREVQDDTQREKEIRFMVRNGINGQEFDIDALPSVTIRELEIELVNNGYLESERVYLFISKNTSLPLEINQTLLECQIKDNDIILISTIG